MADQSNEQAGVSSLPPVDPRSRWLTRHEVALALEISLISVRRRQASGELTGELVNGQWRFPPDQVDGLAESLELDRAAKPTAADAREAGSDARSLFGAAVSLARQAEAHNERLLALIEAPASRLLQQTTTEAGELRKRIAELEEKHSTLLEASQAALDRAHERQLDEQERQAKLALKFEALAALKQWAPMIAGRIMSHQGDTKSANQVLIEALVSSLEPDQLMKLFQSGLLTDAQGAMLVTIAENVAAAARPPPQEPPRRPLNEQAPPSPADPPRDIPRPTDEGSDP